MKNKKLKNKKLILLILDGLGIGKKDGTNPFQKKKYPFFSYLFKKYSYCRCNSSGLFVGLPNNENGNSEIGHLTIGCGRTINHILTLINEDIRSKKFYENKKLKRIFYKLSASKYPLHIIGLVSEGNVHSSIIHLKAVIKCCKIYSISEVYIHAFLDGRDSDIDSGFSFIKELSDYLKVEKIGKIVTLIGRYYAMDRDQNWDRTKIAYEALTMESINKYGIYTKDLLKELSNQYKKGIYDEFINPIILVDDVNNPIHRIMDFNYILFFNFRKDRALQLTECFVNKNFNLFKIKNLKGIKFISMTEYNPKFNTESIYSSKFIENTLSEIISNNNLKQLKIAETEKYAHVTYFLNGGRDTPFKNEDRILIKSPPIWTYSSNPGLSSKEITKKLIKMINKNIYDLIVVNYANLDLIGHTGNFKLAVRSIKIIDKLIRKIYKKILLEKYILLITSDHGNIEYMINNDKTVNKSHTNNQVFFIYIDPNKKNKNTNYKNEVSLCDIAPTILSLLNIKKPKEMTGNSII